MPPRKNQISLALRGRIGTIRPDRIATTGPLSEPTIPVSPQAAGPAVPEREIGPGGVSGCSAMPESEKVQPARQCSRIQGAGGHRPNATPASMSSWRRSSNGSRKTRPRTAEDRSTISASGGQGRGVVWVTTLQKGGGARRWRMRWRVPSTTPTLHSQRAKPSPSWSRLFPETRIGRGLARIAQSLWGKAPWGRRHRVSPPRTPRRGAAQGGGGSGGRRPPVFCRWCGTGEGEVVHAKIHHLPSPFRGVAPSTVIPGGKAIEALPRSGPINRSVLPLDTRRPGSRPSHP